MTNSGPIVVVGAHRSGTSLTARMLIELGVFMGARLDFNAESSYLQRMGRTLLRELGGHWSQPLPAAQALAAAQDLPALTQPLRGYLDMPAATEFWGPRAWRGKRPDRWGWKDPRSGILLPIWQQLEPDLVLVWVKRHPLDCARSLYRRENARAEAFAAISSDSSTRGAVRRITRNLRRQPLVAASWRSLTPEGALEIILEYREHHRDAIPNAGRPTITVDYRSLVTDSRATVRRLVDSLGLAASEASIERAAALPSPKSLDAYLADAEFVELGNRYRERLAALDYVV